MERDELKELLDGLHDRYNRPEFIADDPIGVPHRFAGRDDREIAGFFAATIAWGNRKAIVRSACRMMQYMDNAPCDFTLHASEAELDTLRSFVHRTFNGTDFRDLVCGIRRMYARWGGIGRFVEAQYAACGAMEGVLSALRRELLAGPHDPHCEKHLSAVDRGAACKRLNMYFRWFVRRDDRGVDFGLWRSIPMSALYLPLDLHTGNVGRALGLLRRRQNDWRATVEITDALRGLAPDDPVRYDYALFGAGIDGLFSE